MTQISDRELSQLRVMIDLVDGCLTVDGAAMDDGGQNLDRLPL